MKHFQFLLPVFLVFFFSARAQQTDTIRTFNFSSSTRSGVFQFPNDPPESWSRIKMLYRMRCKNGLVSTTANRNLGCGEWDYSCNTYITDSSRIDSVKASHPKYKINGFAGSSFSFKSQATHIFTEIAQRQTTVSPGGMDTLLNLGGTQNVAEPWFNGPAERKKMQILWRASELLNQSWTAGDIDGLALDLAQNGVTLSDFRIRIRHTSDTVLTGISDTSGLREVYYYSGPFSSTGLQKLFFYRPFYWNGSQNVVIELSWNRPQGQIGPIPKSTPSSYPSVVSNQENDHFLELDGLEGGISCGDIDALDSAQIFTLEAWVNIKNWQNWRGIFKDNGRVVLETGDSPGALYCIIRNPNNTYGFVNNVLPLNTWTHVAMVFDGTKATNSQRLKLYINGIQRTLTFSGNIPSRTEPNNSPLKIGPGVSCRMDDARVWSAALSPSLVSAWMRKKVDSSHPNFSSLQLAYGLDEGTGNVVADASSFQRNGQIEGNTIWRWFRGQEIFKNLEPLSEKPGIQLIRTNSTIQSTLVPILDSIPQMIYRVETFELQNGLPVAIDTQFLYSAAPQPVLNEMGQQIRTKPVGSDGILNLTDLAYFRKSPQKVEIMSFATPYGIGIDFGQEGKVWEFDVSDYVHQLRGRKRISLERGGEFQEQMDIRFVFYRGVPARKVLSLTQIWPVTHSSNADILANRVFEPRQLSIVPNSASWKIRSVITGHGQEGEFISRNHRIVASGQPIFDWPVWTFCGANPIFPQGGTWVYDRAGWCPGAPSDIKEWNLSGLNPGQVLDVDYQMDAAGGDSRYIVNQQLVQYGEPEFQTDAALWDLKAPTDRVDFSRRNPACMNPSFSLKNEGSNPITQAVFSYGLSGGSQASYTWNGNLPFMESTEITLPISDLGTGNGTFQVSLSSVNGQATDQNVKNDTISSPYVAPASFLQRFVIEFKSNSRPEQNSWEFRSPDGMALYGGSNFSANTIYRDTLNLNPGCYEFQFYDDGQDGLNWWANPTQGSGYLRFKNALTGAILKTFNPDFGSEVYLQLRVNATTEVKQNLAQAEKLHIWPLPTADKVQMWWDGEQAGSGRLRIHDLQGKCIYTQDYQPESELDISAWPAGLYYVEVQLGPKRYQGKLVKL